MALFVDLVKAITGLRQNHTITEDTVFSLSTRMSWQLVALSKSPVHDQ